MYLHINILQLDDVYKRHNPVFTERSKFRSIFWNALKRISTNSMVQSVQSKEPFTVFEKLFIFVCTRSQLLSFTKVCSCAVIASNDCQQVLLRMYVSLTNIFCDKIKVELQAGYTCWTQRYDSLYVFLP